MTITNVDITALNTTLNASSGLSYIPRNGFDSSAGVYENIKITATDDSGDSGSGNVMVVLTPPNSWVTSEDTSKNVDLNINGSFELGRMVNGVFQLLPLNGASFDAGTALISARSGSFSDGDFSGRLLISPVADSNGVEALAYRVNNGTPVEIELHVLPVNDAPTVTGATGHLMWVLDGANPSTQLQPFADITIANTETEQQITQIQLSLSGDASDVTLNLNGTDISVEDGVSGTIGNISYRSTLIAGNYEIIIDGAWTSAEANTFIQSLGFATNSPQISKLYSLTLNSVQDNGGTALGGEDTATVDETATIRVMNENLPVVNAGFDAAVTENAALSNILSTFSVTHAGLDWANDGSGDYLGSQLSVAFADNPQSGDTFDFVFTSPDYTVDTVAKTLSHFGVVIATYDDSNNQLLVTFKEANRAQTQIVGRAIAYQADTDQPNSSAADLVRNLNVSLTDARGVSETDTIALTVRSVNDAATLASTASDSTFSENASPVNLYNQTMIDTVEDFDTVKSISFTVAGVSSNTEQVFIGTPDSGSASAINLHTPASGTILHGSQIIEYNVSLSGRIATVELSAQDGIPLSAADAASLVDSIQYQNTASALVNDDVRIVSLSNVVERSIADGIEVLTSTSISGIDTTITFNGSIFRAVEDGDAVKPFGNREVTAVSDGDQLTIRVILAHDNNSNGVITSDVLSAPGFQQGTNLTLEDNGIEVADVYTTFSTNFGPQSLNLFEYRITVNSDMTVEAFNRILDGLQYEFTQELITNQGILEGDNPVLRFEFTTSGGLSLNDSSDIEVPVLPANDAPTALEFNSLKNRNYASSFYQGGGNYTFFPNISFGTSSAISLDATESNASFTAAEVVVQSFDYQNNADDFFAGETFSYKGVNYNMQAFGRRRYCVG